ncbi:5'-3' exonuclease PLD3 [Drosophila tropicalis]|uniref:5'-3' exonuclease PLD3 n=1 Tax=Drosophila tropicalis TaxID=46794 RepID=UPI0035ABC7D3
MLPYKHLSNAEEDQEENGDRQRAKTAHALQMVCLSVFLLLFLGASLFQSPTPPRRNHERKNHHGYQSSVNEFHSCEIQLVETIPVGLNYTENSPKFMSTFAAWTQLLNNAKNTIDIASFYWTLRGEDTGTNHSSTKQGEEIFNSLLANGDSSDITKRLKIRIAQSEPSSVSPNMDTKYLASNGAADVVSINMPKYFDGGVLHTKLWIVDGQHLYLGSANMDWRALTQVKEMGILVQDCPRLAEDVGKIFKAYWVLGSKQPDSLPSWDERVFGTDYTLENPLNLQLNGTISMEGFISGAPPSLAPRKRTNDLDAIIDVIDRAVLFVDIAVMDYYPLIIYEKSKHYWPYIDDAIRRAAVDRGVTVRLLISWWKHSNPSEDNYLRSLQQLTAPKENIRIEVRRFIVPVDPDQESLPFTRVNHNKYMVTDRAAYIGTSNWSGDYFTNTAGIGLTLRETHDTESGQNIRQDLQSVFDRDWNSPYAHEFK